MVNPSGGKCNLTPLLSASLLEAESQSLGHGNIQYRYHLTIMLHASCPTLAYSTKTVNMHITNL